MSNYKQEVGFEFEEHDLYYRVLLFKMILIFNLFSLLNLNLLQHFQDILSL